jgi:tetratricopeptide (TPR) repeat protein
VGRRSFVDGVAVVLLVGALLAAAAGLQHVREEKYPSIAVADATLYITSGNTLRRMTAGYNALAADLYWIRAIQSYGDIRLKRADAALALKQVQQGNALAPDPSRGAPADYSLLYPLLDLTTSLDPRFNIAYRFGAIFLAEAYPGGAGRPDLAVALLEKGLRERPDKWEYMQDIGFVYYWWVHDYRAAADWFSRGSQVPRAPWWLRSLAATTLAEGGDRQSSRTMWEAIRQSAEIDWLRRDAERRLSQLTALDQIDDLQNLVDQVMKRDGAPPAGWTPLLGGRPLPGVPVDPAGTPYEIDASGRVRLSVKSPLFPIPQEPQRLNRAGPPRP